MSIESTIISGIAFLAKSQQQNGSFLSLSSPEENNFSKAIIFPSVFSTTLILSSLISLEEFEGLQEVKEKAVSFLLSQKSKDWSFNYWDRNSDQYKNIPYPDDLDDTFCALAALHLFDPKILDGIALGKTISLLTTLEVEEGGPYRTWLVESTAKKEWLDIDFAVNANIAYFLSLLDISLPKQIQFLEEEIEKGNISSPYYPTDFPSLYFISRFYKGQYKSKLIKILKESNPKNSLENALVSLSLINFNERREEVKKYVDRIIKDQKDNKWEACSFYVGVNPKRDRSYFAGSDALTSAFCLQALSEYQRYALSSPGKNLETRKIELDRSVLGQVKKRYSRTGRNLQDQAIETIDKVKAGDEACHITLTPFFFSQALGNNGSRIGDELLTALGAVNLYGWIAYTIYDDFLDEEGDVAKLSVANVALREVTGVFESILPGTGFVNYAHDVMDMIDSANTWEVTMARNRIKKSDNLKDIQLPDWGNLEKLSARSFGHALGSIALLYSLGFYDLSPEVKNLEKFFKSYLIAKQLNDDAHDWQEDLKNGHLTPVVTRLLSKLLEKKPVYIVTSIEVLIEELNEIFWYDVILGTCEEILTHVQKAKKSIKNIPLIEKPEILESLLIDVEGGALKALRDQKRTIDFLNIYS
jgi:hypothetical protein